MNLKSTQYYSPAVLVLAMGLILCGEAWAQEELPVVHANSTKADIQDGNRFLRGGWTIQSDVELDTYYARRAKGDRKITFRTDLDSISFDVRPGKSYDFIVLLNGQRCRTRISTLHEVGYKENVPGVLEEGSIPFTIGRDLKIHMTGKINESPSLDLLFDTGADTCAVFPSGLAKIPNLRVDGTVKNGGVGGIVTCNTSSDNRILLGTMHWDHESFVLIDKQLDQADGLIGHNLFENKVVEIDFDAGVLRLSDSVPERAKAWTSLPIRFNGTLPSIQVRVDCGHESFDEWLVMDTGSHTSVHLSGRTSKQSRLFGSLKQLGESLSGGTGDGVIRSQMVRLPKMNMGNLELAGLPIEIEVASQDSTEPSGYLGMDVLKRFNMVLDFQNNVAYISPSTHFENSYRADGTDNRWRVAVGTIVVILVVIGVIFYRRRVIAKRSKGLT